MRLSAMLPSQGLTFLIQNESPAGIRKPTGCPRRRASTAKGRGRERQMDRAAYKLSLIAVALIAALTITERARTEVQGGRSQD